MSSALREAAENMFRSSGAMSKLQAEIPELISDDDDDERYIGDGSDWTSPDEAIETLGLHDCIENDPRFLVLDSHFQPSGTVMTHGELVEKSAEARRRLAEEMLPLSQPELEGLLQSESVIGRVHERITVLVRDLDRLCHECAISVTSRDDLIDRTERTEHLAHQVDQLVAWVAYFQDTSLEKLGLDRSCRRYESGLGFNSHQQQSSMPPSVSSCPTAAQIQAMNKHVMVMHKQATDAADKAMQELIAEEAAEKRKSGKLKANPQQAAKKKGKKKGKPAKKKPVPVAEQSPEKSDASDDDVEHDSAGHCQGDSNASADQTALPELGCQAQVHVHKVGREVQMTQEQVNQMHSLLEEQRAQKKKPARAGRKATADIAKASAFDALRDIGEDPSFLEELARAKPVRNVPVRQQSYADTPQQEQPSTSNAATSSSTRNHSSYEAPMGSRPNQGDVSHHMNSLQIGTGISSYPTVQELMRLCQQHGVWLHTAFLNAMNPNNRHHVPILRSTYTNLSKAAQKVFWDAIPSSNISSANTAAMPPRPQGSLPSTGFGPRIHSPLAAAGVASPQKYKHQHTSLYAAPPPPQPPAFTSQLAPGSRPQPLPKPPMTARQRRVAAPAPPRGAPPPPPRVSPPGYANSGHPAPAPAPPAPAVTHFDDDEEHEENLCVVCMERARNALVMPCRHTVTCIECAVEIQSTLGFCPYCRLEVDEVYQIG